MNIPEHNYFGKIAVLYEEEGDEVPFRQLAKRLAVPLRNKGQSSKKDTENLFLAWRGGRLTLIDRDTLNKGGLSVNFNVRSEVQRSWPAAKKGLLAQAIGRKTKTVIDATTGWGQDSFYIFRMGYQLSCIERSPIMAELLADGLQRLSKQEWIMQLGIKPPQLLFGDAILILNEMLIKPDCIYLDPMFPPKRKKSALTRKSMHIIRELLGDDPDKEELFAAALNAAGRRVVVKRPEYAEPLAKKVNESFLGKLVRYDVYLK